MSSYDHREPTNEELWPQPPNQQYPAPNPPGQAMVPQQPAPVPVPNRAADRSRFILAIASMGMGIPISAIAAESAGPFGLVIAWVAIVAVNFIYSWRRP
ncbi:MAG: hypothetical protein LCH76_04650 [Actinobacteria bacterium]|nr:hypothetical protein [Actinomycetota bacterium]